VKPGFVCLDWGGSDITGFCFNSERFLKNFRLPGGNLRILSSEQLEEICRQLLDHTESVRSTQLTWAIGAAGADDINASQRLYSTLKIYFPDADINIYSDYVCNHAACLNGQDGILSVNGTGSIVYAALGTFKQRASGWGYLFDELPSGAYFGRKAIEGVLKFIEGQIEFSAFADAFSIRNGTPDRRIIIDQIYRSRSIQKEIGNYAPILTDAFTSGCSCAKDIIVRSVNNLTDTVQRLIGNHTGPISFCGSGGLWKNWPALKEMAMEEFDRKNLNLVFTAPQKPLQAGALIHYANDRPEFQQLFETIITQEQINDSRK